MIKGNNVFVLWGEATTGIPFEHDDINNNDMNYRNDITTYYETLDYKVLRSPI